MGVARVKKCRFLPGKKLHGTKTLKMTIRVGKSRCFGNSEKTINNLAK